MTRDLKKQIQALLNDDVKEKIDHAQQTVTHYVKKNPMKTIGFSLLAGAIVAQLLRGKKKSR